MLGGVHGGLLRLWTSFKATVWRQVSVRDREDSPVFLLRSLDFCAPQILCPAGIGDVVPHVPLAVLPRVLVIGQARKVVTFPGEGVDGGGLVVGGDLPQLPA